MGKENSILNGLVLTGGKSSRMGFDKRSIQWHGMEQQYYMAGLLKNFCDDVYMSVKNEEQAKAIVGYKTIVDTVTGLGPFGAILSAFEFQPDAAWFVVACDLPLLDKETLEYLSKNRNRNAIATTFKSPFDGLPEPLITIWEPNSYAVLREFQSNGYTCPRKVLIRNGNTQILNPSDPDALMNVNTPQDFESAKQIIAERNHLREQRV
ncbi:MAG: NTP transferase domain-containing protein [Bacteroidetes bacterium]|nr:NTP transferase domain-containing protein [Bacteroidota bacterium]